MTKKPHVSPGRQAMLRLTQEFFARIRGEAVPETSEPTPAGDKPAIPAAPRRPVVGSSPETQGEQVNDFELFDLLVPLVPPRGRPGRQVNVTLSDQQAAALSSIFDGLKVSGGRLVSGRPVTTSADAVRWLLEEIFGTWTACCRRPKKTTRQARRPATKPQDNDH